VGALHSNEDIKPKIRYCHRCEDLFQVMARLGPKVLLPGVPKQSDYDLWSECRNCGTLYPKHETKVEPELEPIKEPSDGKQVKSQGIGRKRKSTNLYSCSQLGENHIIYNSKSKGERLQL
jgi:DNA-directed RNA polymerase subunit M/transcription elongation factor TFIIS